MKEQRTDIDEALHWQHIGHLIFSAQRRCTKGVATAPLALAQRAMKVVDEARRLRRDLVAHSPSPRRIYWQAQLWEPGPQVGELATVVFICERWVCARREVIEDGWVNGELLMIVPEGE